MKFVGRSVELRELDRALEPGAKPSAAWITGPAGSGKTALARHFATRAASDGHAVQWVACDEATELRDEIAARLARLRAARGRGPAAGVIVLDGLDRFEGLDRWLLDEAATLAGPGLSFVVTARRRVAATLRTMADPCVALRELHLGSLAAEEVVEALVDAGVPEHDHARGIGLTKGHPLTLALVLERFAREPRLPLSLSDEPGILADVVADLLRDAPASEHRLALHALAIAGIVDEALLGRATGTADAHGLFTHLASLSIVERSKHGLIAQSLVRDVLYREHALRNPEEHAAVVSRIAEGVRDRRRQARGPEEALRLDCQAAFVEAPSAALRECCDFRFLADVSWSPASSEQIPELAQRIERFEGAGSRRRFEASTSSSHVLVRRDGSIAALAVVAGLGGRRADLEWLSGPEHHAMGREVWTALVALEAMLRTSAETRELAWTLASTDPLVRHLPALGFARVVSAPDEAAFVLSIAPAEEGSPPRRGGPAPTLPTLPTLPSPLPGAPRAPIDRAAFDAAWRATLPLLHRPHELEASPLLATHLGKAGPPALLAAAAEACSALASSAGYADSARVLDVSFVHRAVKQEAAAAELGVPFGTYRYQLRKAIALLVEELWRRESACARTADPG